MSGPIQTLPKGLLDSLQLKSLGKNPSELLETLQAVIDLREQYFVPLYKNETSFGGVIQTALITASSGGQPFQVGGATLTVPSTKLWYVIDATVTMNTVAAADRINGLSFATIDSGSTSFHMRAVPVNDVSSATVVRSITAKIDRPFWLQGGSQFFLFATDIVITAPGSHAQLAITFVELIP